MVNQGEHPYQGDEIAGTEECEIAPKRAAVGFENFTRLFAPPKEVESQTQNTHQKFQDALSKFLNERVREATTALKRSETGIRAQQALDSLLILSETLGGLPQSVTEIQQRANRGVRYERVTDRGAHRTEEFKGISFIVSPPEGAILLKEPVRSVRLDVVLEKAGRTPQQIRVNFYGGEEDEGYELTSLRFDIHHFAQGNRLQIDLEGRALELVARKHHDLPSELDQEAFTQLQHLLVFNLCPSDKHVRKEYYLKQFLKAVGIKGEKAGSRQELIDEVMARYPGTPQYERKRKERRQSEEDTRRREQEERERRKRLELITSCERGLEEIIAETPALTGWVADQRKEQSLLPEDSNGRAALNFILGIKVNELVTAAIERPLTRETEMLLRDIPSLTRQAIEKRHELTQLGSREEAKPEIEALEYIRDLAAEIATPQEAAE